jgi:hypothetical protein
MGVGNCGASLLGSHNKQESSAPLASHITTPSANQFRPKIGLEEHHGFGVSGCFI